jgi:hypothetical protein
MGTWAGTARSSAVPRGLRLGLHDASLVVDDPAR